MVRPATQLAVIGLLITSTVLVHHLARLAVAEGIGLAVLVILLLSLIPLRHYLD